MYLLEAVLDPLGFFWVSMGLALLISKAARSALSGILLLLWLLLFFASSPVLVNQTLIRIAESAPAGPCKDEITVPLVVLGGGMDPRAVDSNDIHLLTKASLERAFTGIRKAKMESHSLIILSGGSSRHAVRVSESELMQQLFLMSGVSAGRLLQEGNSSNTYENAVFTRELMEQADIPLRIRLLTSALHLPRASAAYEKQGVEVCATIPADSPGNSKVPFYALLPDSQTLGKTAEWLHEFIGWWYYKLNGWG